MGAHLFCVLEMCRRGGMLRPFPRWAGRTHEITHYPVRQTKRNSLAFQKTISSSLSFHNACSNELCEFMSADRGVLSIYCRATVLLQRVFCCCTQAAWQVHT